MLLPLLILNALLLPLADASFSETTSRKLLKLCAGAYGTSANENSCASTNCDLLNITTCSGYIVNSGSTLYVVFAGSQDNTQLAVQFIAAPLYTNYHSKGLVNQYVASAADKMWLTIKPILQNPAYAGYNVVFTGHSLGAALSTVTAARSIIDGVLNMGQISVWTFGEPRTESYQFSSWFDSSVASAGNNIRVVHRNDYIAQLPPCEFVTGLTTKCQQLAIAPYQRGTEYWYNNDMTLTDTFTATCSDADFSLCPFNYTAWLNPSGPINDHSGYYLYDVPTYGRAGCVQ